MFILEAIQSAIVALLVSYLSFTGSLAQYVASRLPQPSNIPPTAIQETLEQDTTQNTASKELELFSKLFATGGIARILSENDAFQRAAEGTRGTANVLTSIHDQTSALDAVERSLVNIFCEYKTSSYTRTTTGTGFFINERGVILSNAHVAQFLLLESLNNAAGETECIIRSGNPATPQYRAELLFISPTWVFNNAALIAKEHPRGTGEYDYALLYISDSLNKNALPEKYPALPVHTEFLSKQLTGKEVITAGYPAEKLSREGSRATLTPSIAKTYIKELYTFGSNYADIFSITESPVGEQGASGGPVVDPALGTIGLIVTKGDSVTEGEKSLRALTLSYIDRVIKEETGYTLIENTGGDLAYRGKVFKEALVPFLAQLLSYELTGARE